MTTETSGIKNTGLRGVTVASTKISDVQGDAGKLIYRGYLVQALAENASFEEVAYLLLKEKLPTAKELAEFKAQLSSERFLPEAMITALRTIPANALPMDVLQAGISMLAAFDADTRNFSRDACVRMAVRLIAKVAVIVAAWHRIRNGKVPITALNELGHGANFMYMLTGEKPKPEVGRFMDKALVLHAEHSFNASTFAAREVASTRAHIYAATSAAVGSLSGELHGSANVRVMEMLLKIGDSSRVEAYVKQELEAGRKLMGLGHAVYKTDDPRSFILAPMAQKMGELAGETKWYDMAKRLEVAGKEAFRGKKGREIYVNVDFYSAPLYYAMGIPVDLFSSVFAVSRVAGWVSHVLEEQFADAAPKAMLYRPESEYIGNYCGPAECEFIPQAER
ncbi:MAG: citrate/2-methylcitrate synthase [Desulfobacterales bacterium]|jgi:citrate synthase|nr:citrate/2-methylcitrate synthase [Desulfobacterales bacterium]